MKAYSKELYPFESKWVNIYGNRVHYIDEGHGELILFSHPPLASSFMYREFVKVLRNNYRCVALDYPGFGLSAPGDKYQVGVEAQSQILEQFILKLGLNNIFVLGHDTGGPSAFRVAIERPSLFKGLILTDTIIYPVSEYKKLARMLDIVGGKLFTQFNAVTNFLVSGTYKYGVKTRKLTEAERSEYRRMFSTAEQRIYVTQMLYSLKESEEFMMEVKQGFETTLNSKPALLIYGEKDPVAELGIADRIHGLMPNSELFLIDKEGHFPHEGQAEQMSELIHNWILRTKG